MPVQYLSFGCSTAHDFWLEVCVPSHIAFFARQSRATAIQAAWPTWHVHEWLWHKQNPGKPASGKAFKSFQNSFIAKCPELGWLRDVTDASKHCGLGRKTQVSKVTGFGVQTTGTVTDPLGSYTQTRTDPLVLVVDGIDRQFPDVLRAAIKHLQNTYFS